MHLCILKITLLVLVIQGIDVRKIVIEIVYTIGFLITWLVEFDV
jgi:hypothetical protein